MNHLKEFYENELKKGYYKKIDFDDLENQFNELTKQFFPFKSQDNVLKNELDFLELIHYRNNLLWLNIHQKFEFHTETNEIDEKELRDLFYDYTSILTLIQNNLQTLHFLLTNGFDHQALIILRNHLELFELMLSILGDNQIYKDYKQLIQTNGTEINKSIKFVNTHKANKKILEKLKEKKGFEIYEGFFDELAKLKDKYYKKFSSFAHPDRTNIMLSAFVQINEEELECSLGGKQSINTKTILNDLFTIEVIMFQYILAMQIEKHKMYFEKYGDDSERLALYVGGIWNIHMYKNNG